MELKYSLKDTVEWMYSDDWKVRLKAEYWQLMIRLEKLRYCIVNIEDSDRDIFIEQYNAMIEYMFILERKAWAYCIDLDNKSIQYLYGRKILLGT